MGNASVLVADVGHAEDGSAIQYNVVRVDGQPSVYLPVLKQGGDANTIAVVDGIKRAVAQLLDVPKQLVTKVVFDQSVFVRNAIENLIHEGADRAGADRRDDSGLPRQHAGDAGGVFVHSACRRWRRSSRWRWATARSTR